MTLEYLRKRHTRVIIRNLSFQATEDNVADKLLKFGPLVEVNIPRVPSSSSPTSADKESRQKQRGFAFATYLCEADAKAAVGNSQGLKICNREVAIDYAMSKTVYLREGQEAVEGDADHDKEEFTSRHDTNEADKDGEVSDEDEIYDSHEDIDVDNDDDIQEDVDESDIDEAELRNQFDVNAEAEGATKAPQKQKTTTSDVEEGCTLFVRSVPFDATDDDVRRAFSAQGVGKIVLAIVVKDKTTGQSKGCAFVKFAEKDIATACLEKLCDGYDEDIGHITIVDRKCM